jgi:hypothetical protein
MTVFANSTRTTHDDESGTDDGEWMSTDQNDDESSSSQADQRGKMTRLRTQWSWIWMITLKPGRRALDVREYSSSRTSGNGSTRAQSYDQLVCMQGAGGTPEGRESNIGTTFGFSVGQCLSVCLLMPSSWGEDLRGGGSKDLGAFVSPLIGVLPTKYQTKAEWSELPRGLRIHPMKKA